MRDKIRGCERVETFTARIMKLWSQVDLLTYVRLIIESFGLGTLLYFRRAVGEKSGTALHDETVIYTGEVSGWRHPVHL